MTARAGATASLCALAAAVAVAGGCGGGDERSAANLTGASVQRGHDAIEKLGCASCHQIDGVEGANGRVGPSLVGVEKRQYIAGGRLTTTPENMVHWIRDPQDVLPGTAMPDLGIDEATARDIVAYLYGR